MEGMESQRVTNQSAENSMFEGGLTNNRAFNNSNHRVNESTMSFNTLMNIQNYEEQHLIELKLRLDEEMQKNEGLERKIRTMEFENLIKTNELNRKIQELQMNNQHLNKQLQEQSPKNQQLPKDDQDFSQTMLEMENKLFIYENEILSLKERETDLLNQINQLRSEGFDLRMKAERFSFFAGVQSPKAADNKCPIPSGRRRSVNKALTPARMTRSSIHVNTVNQAFNNSNQMQQQRLTQNQMFRLSVLSTHQQFGLDQVEALNDLNEAKQIIRQMTQDKEQLEMELKQAKDKAINQILAKEQQIIELIKFHEDQTDVLKQESARLQLEVQNFQKQDRQKGSEDNQLVTKLERQISQLRNELIYSEEKYEKLHQKYLEERRQQEQEIAYLQDKYQKDIQYYQAKLDKQKERTKSIMIENERIKNKLLQSQDFKQEIITQIEDYEQKIREIENEKHQIESEFMYKLDIKSQIIQEKTVRIQELQDQLFKFEDQLKDVQAQDQLKYQKEIHEIRDLLREKQSDYQDQEIELENTRYEILGLQQQVNELTQKKSMLNHIIKELQGQIKQMEDNHQEERDDLEQQIQASHIHYQQQIQTLKTHIEFLEQSQQPSQQALALQPLQTMRSNYMSQVEECTEEDETNHSKIEYESERAIEIMNTESTMGTNREKKNSQLKVQTQSLMDELCQENMQEERFSIVQNHVMPYVNRGASEFSPRYSMASNNFIYDQIDYRQSNLNNYYTSPLKQMTLEPKSNPETDSKIEDLLKEIDALKQQILVKNQEIENLHMDMEQMQLQLNEKDEELDEFEDQLKISAEEIEKLKTSKEEMSTQYKQQLHQYAASMKTAFKELQLLRKTQVMNQTKPKIDQGQIIQLNNENLELKRKLRRLEQQNEDLIEQMMTQKQQFSQEKNHLRIQLTCVEEQIMQSKLQYAQIVMEKDLIGIKLKEITTQLKESKEHQEKKEVKRVQVSRLQEPGLQTTRSLNIFTKHRNTNQSRI